MSKNGVAVDSSNYYIEYGGYTILTSEWRHDGTIFIIGKAVYASPKNIEKAKEHIDQLNYPEKFNKKLEDLINED